MEIENKDTLLQQKKITDSKLIVEVPEPAPIKIVSQKTEHVPDPVTSAGTPQTQPAFVNVAQDVTNTAYKNAIDLANVTRDLIDTELQIKQLKAHKTLLIAKRDRHLGIALSMHIISEAHVGEQ